MAHTFKTFEPKDPIEKLDYLFDWAGDSNNNGLSDWLAQGETIVSHVVTVNPADELSIFSSEIVNSATAVLIWVTDGTNNSNYEVRCQITTSLGRISIRTAILPVKKR